MNFKFIRLKYLIIFIALSGVFFRLYNLSWGSPFFFHPDERNIASSVSQLVFPSNLNPHFFAYGSLPIYITYFLGIILNFFENMFTGKALALNVVSFENAILTGRVISAFMSVAIIFLVYTIGNKLFNHRAGIISMILASLSVGLIQYAHFSTFEMWLSLFTLLLFYNCTLYVAHKRFVHIVFSALVLGILISIKISSLFYLPICIFIFSIIHIKDFKKSKKGKFIFLEQLALRLCVFVGICLVIVNITSPYFWIDNSSFLSIIKYESDVALGTLRVFYTQVFEGTVPIIYQTTKVYPFILNPAVSVVGLISVIISIYIFFKKRDTKLLLLLIFLLITYISQVFLFVKWTRYYVPTLPLLYLIMGVSFSQLMQRPKAHKTSLIIIGVVLLISYIYSFSYFKTVLFDTDTRMDASIWAKNNILKDSFIVSEVYDMGIVPFNRFFNTIELQNFYDLENEQINKIELKRRSSEMDYFILVSQRVLDTRLAKPTLYPVGHSFYSKLNSNKFNKIYQTPCDIFCKILYLGSPQFSFEQTANVFDRPTVVIYKNVK